MHRREFIHLSTAVVGSTATSHTLLAVESAADAEVDLGRHIYKSLKWNMVKTTGSVLDKFKMIKQLGYDGIELDSPDDVDKAEALDASRETGLPIEGIVNATHWRVRHSDPDPAIRAQAVLNMRTAMREARQVGADSVLLVPGRVSDPEQENHDQVWQRSIADIRRLIPYAEQLNVKILIENVGNGFCTDPQTFAQYIDEIDSTWVGVHFDIGNHIRFSPPAKWIRILGTRIRKIDVKDRRRGSRDLVPIGEGDADWRAVRAALRAVGYRGWAAAEVNGGDEPRLAEVLQLMNGVLGESDHRPTPSLPGATRAAS